MLFVLLFAAINAIPAAASNIERPTSNNSAATETHAQIVEILPTDFKPAFTRHTVIKLNAIVEESYAAILEFDRFKKDLESTIIKSKLQQDHVKQDPGNTLNKPQQTKVHTLVKRSKIAQQKMASGPLGK